MIADVTPITDSSAANSGRGMMNALKITQGRWFSMAIIIVFAAVMIAASIAPALADTAITNCMELQNIRNDLSGDYYLANDIDCSGFDCGDGKGFMPIGNMSSQFTGTFDGKGYKITNLYINRSSMNCVGLFGNTSSESEITNVGLEDVDVTGSSWVGGLFGLNSGTITNCYSTGSVGGSSSSSSVVGGLVGSNVMGTITNCNSTGNFVGYNNVGGLVGFNGGTITNCNSTGNFVGYNNVGGLVGFNGGTITYCYSTGDIISHYAVCSYLGGLVGLNMVGTITNCYSTVCVAYCHSESGGLVGYDHLGTITNSYWDTETSGQSSSYGGTGKTTAEMKQQATFENWDFGTIWAIEEDVTYPYLRQPPSITYFAPPSPVNDTVWTWKTFTVTTNQEVNVIWYLNNSLLFTNVSVTEASYTFHAEHIGEHNVSAVAENANGTVMQTWVWNVTAAPTAPELTFPCTCGDICVNTSGWWHDGGVFNANATTPIQAAVDAAAAGETICVAAGSYTENVNVNKQVTLQGEGMDVVNVIAASLDDHVFEVTADYVNISGFNVTGATGTYKAGIYLSSDTDYCNISNNNASGNFYGIHLYSSSNNMITNNNASGNYEGIYLYFYSSNNTITNNTASNNNYGIRLDSSSNYNTITNNNASNNNNWDIYIQGSSSTFTDNTLNGTTVSFTYDGNVSLKGVGSPAADPSGRHSIGKFIDATNQSAGAWLFLNVSYNESDVPADMQESTLRMWKHDGSWHEVAGSGVNEAENYVYANITEFSIFAPLGDVDVAPPEVTIDAPTQSTPVLIAGGGQFWVNFTYTELYPANYTVTIRNATVLINSTTNTSVAGGTGMTANESFNLNASAADGLYNVTVGMYDNSLNYNISYQNHSVEKGSYDASISQPENQTTEPGVNATYELNITNTGNFTGTFTLAVTNHNGADVATLNKTTITDLATGASQNVTLNVTDVSAGTYNVTVNVTSTDSGSEVAITGYIMTMVVGPTLTLGNVNDITSDWGKSFNLNHSVTVTNATASNVNVTYNVSWITNNNTMGMIAKDGMKWHNQTPSNPTVQNITARVDANTTTASAMNDSKMFSINITRRDINVTANPGSGQTVGVGDTFWINGSAKDEHNEAFIVKADLVKDGSIVNTTDVTNGNANFSTDESAAGTFNFSIRFHNTTHYDNASTSNKTVTVLGPILTLGNVTGITSDWGRSFNLNHSVTVTNATANNVNVTYNVSWILDDSTMGTISQGGMRWHNQTPSNPTVQNITLRVDANTTTASAMNDSKMFSINITRREIIITADPIAPQSVNPNTTFWINGSADDEYAETFIGFADLVRNGSIIDNKTTTDGNANFSRTEPAEGTFNYSIRFYNTTHYNNRTTNNATMHIVDDTAPASITGLDNLTTEQSRIHWTWRNPADADFAEVMIYLNGTFKTNVSKGDQNYTATGLDPDTNYTIGTHTVDDKGNINQAWVNDTARTLPFSGLQRINVTPTSLTLNISESKDFNATGYDHKTHLIDPANLTFAWGTTPPGIGTLNATTGSVVNFTALHAGLTGIYAINGSVSSNKVWITVNAPPEPGNVTNGTGNATSGNSTVIVNLKNESVNGTITIEEIGDPLNKTKDIGNRTGLGTDSEPVKGVNVTVTGSIEAALNDTGGYLHIRVEYNESQLGNIDEDTLYIYKFVNGTGWVKLVQGKPIYCIANGRNPAEDYVWVNVTNCSTFMLAGTPTAAPTPTPTPPGSSSGGGGIGVSSGNEPGNVEESVVRRIYLRAGSSSTYNFNNVVTSVEVTPDRTYGQVAARIEVLHGQPGSITTALPAGELYKYVNIFVGTTGWAEGKLSSSVINFQVPESWFEENNIDPESVVMYRHNNGKWDSLTTTMSGQAGGNYQYSSPSPGFSTFLILGQVGDSGTGETADAPDSGTESDSTPTPVSTSTKGTPGFGVLAGIMGIMVAVYSRKK